MLSLNRFPSVTIDPVFASVTSWRFVLCWLLLAPIAQAQKPGPEPPSGLKRWDRRTLKQVPKTKWLDRTGAVHLLLYQGEPYDGLDTEVFAFYASPATLGEAEPNAPYPGVVLIHGGGGTAFAEWVWLWAKRGYAAIAMDLSGSRPMAPVYDAQGVPVPNQASKSDMHAPL